ncbi:MAG TPA: C40 family peptidase [Bacteroidales bacterium]|nr:C40 family peptidase [Bacteroidales bacterium]HQH19876.1 C40 family peptidase [Bacteroidales bacterium]HQI46400.1 C40 family peptidase [Bacteroidales bacterium]
MQNKTGSMRFGMCNLSMVPVRFEPSHKSEMVTQLLFGELFEIIEKTENWSKVKLIYDQYEGWVDVKQYLPLYNETFEKLHDFGSTISIDIVHVLINETKNYVIPIVLGSSLPFVVNQTFYIDDHKYSFEGNVRPSKEDVTPEKITENAYMYLDAPYLWGGRSPFGIDCSGLVQMTYKLSGIKLPRDAGQQASCGTTINLLSEAQAGDLAFFDNEEGIITHVGIILPNNQIIHASGRVRVDSLDHEGIYNVKKKQYSHKLRLIKRII